ncbi:MAG: rRNA adenine N-6-methyltransferase family protein [Metamycoplasmataceae bacterium]
MVKKSINTHLTYDQKIKTGSFFTNSFLVNLVYNKIKSYITKNSIIADFGAGYGSFIEKFQKYGKKCFGTEIDYTSFIFLKNEFKNIDIYYENSLINVNREKYNLSKNDELIIIGNPPYNDVTSIFKKGKKGKLNSDKDLFSRDLGISFLKAFEKLNAKYICILHPLAYLIKKQNFNSLNKFKSNYKLISGTIFSSKEFESLKKANSEFPVVCALYKKDEEGMEYEFIYNFNFEILNSNNFFCLNKIKTIDGKIKKYPKKNECLGLQFYTLRDMNALIRNASFIENKKNNGIKIDENNLYQYAWLFFLKQNFRPQNFHFLFSNLSPLYTDKIENKNIKLELISYAYKNNKLIKKYFTKEKIENLYGKLTNNFENIFNEIKNINNKFK